MTNQTIKCPKCHKELQSRVCPSHEDFERCINCFGVGFIVECQDCCWQWNGEEIEKTNIKKDFFSIDDIPRLAEILDQLKSEKAKTVVPKFKMYDRVHRSGYSEYSGEIEEIEISVGDNGEPTITYTIENVGTAWESELELSKR